MSLYIYQVQLSPKYQQAENRDDQYSNIISAHFSYLKCKLDDGVLLLAGRTALSEDNPENFGISIFRAENEKAAQEFTLNDPAIRKGIMQAKIFPYNLALINKNFEL